MKITTRDVTLIQILGIILIVAVTVATMLYPDALGNEHSLRSIEEKEAKILSLNDELSSTERDYQNALSNLNLVKKNAESIKKESDSMRISIRNTEFGLHMPSILIALEQKANEYNLEFLMDYDKLKTIGAETPTDAIGNPELDAAEGATPEDVTPETEAAKVAEENQEKETKQSEKPATKTSTPEAATKDSETKKDSEAVTVTDSSGSTTENAEKSGEEALTDVYNPEEVDISAAYENVPSIPGLSVTIIPVRVSGTYADVRAFIQYLEDVDLISHNWVDLHSYGEDISGIIVFNVFHSEEGDSY